MYPYISVKMKKEIVIESIVTVHYFEYGKDYSFIGEKHNFWELLYVDKGEVKVIADEKTHNLCQGDIVFHKPNEFHNVIANGIVAPNLVVIAFVCNSNHINYFKDKILRIIDDEQVLLANIINEARNVFKNKLDDPNTKEMIIKENPKFGGQQLIKTYLEELLIKLIRRNESMSEKSKLASSIKIRADSDLVNEVIDYMNKNACNNIKFNDICKFSAQSATNLKTIFKSVTGYGVMEYYRLIRIEKAKQLLREGKGNITQISEKLGYSSVHYFSRYFKQITGMTPTEYTYSIQSK